MLIQAAGTNPLNNHYTVVMDHNDYYQASLGITPWLISITFLCLICMTTELTAANDLEEGIKAFDNKDYHRAHNLWLPLAEKGHAEAQLFMGVLYRYGFGVDRNPPQSAKWFKRAADNGDVDAQNEVAFIYEQGWGVKRDPAEAERWYETVRQQGFCLSDTAATGRLDVDELWW